MSPFDYNANDEGKKRDMKARIPEKGPLLNRDHHFIPVDSDSSSQRVLGENVMHDII